ncbi:MAG: hypothetical protein NBV67_11175 [Tagaea sp.]|nr:hypothetical protein [Tagaea sp.]
MAPAPHSVPTRPSWALNVAVFLGVMGASAGATFLTLSQIGPARAIPSPMPIGIVQELAVAGALAPAPPPRRVAVDSVPGGLKIDPGAIRDISIGWVDSARADEDGAVLVVAGWAGDAGLGLRIPRVGVGACGVVVASVPVEGERPDVRASVHPHLDRAGWTARIFAEHLPVCEGRTLEAYAFLPGGRVLAKLAIAPGAIPDLAGAGAEADGPSVLFRPGDLSGPELGRARVAVPQSLRRCAGTECAETARLPRGDHLVAVLDRRDGWALVKAADSDRAGWLPERQLDSAPERLAQR